MNEDRHSEDRNPAAAEQLKGSIKEALGKLTGDAAVEAEGRRQKREAGDGKAPPGAAARHGTDATSRGASTTPPRRGY